ncbi:hypothetical protein Tco_0278767, partial [Tanacetum coccineum]
MESKDVATLNGLRRAETVNSTHVTHLFWPSIGDDRFNVGNTKAKSIRKPRIKLAHRCITMTITEELSHALFERSLEYEKERVAVTFEAIWRPVLALESWAGQTHAQREALWHAISDMQGENRDLQLQLAEEK